MRVKRTIPVDFDFDVDISFKEACTIVMEKMKTEDCESFQQLSDIIIREYESIENVSIVDKMKDEVLEKIKAEFTLDQIEKFYESKR